MSCNLDYEKRIQELEARLADSDKEVRNLKLAVRAESLKVKISSEYSNFGLWEYDIADDICYQYKKLNGIYEAELDPIVHFRDTIISWGSVYVDDIPVFHKFCDAMERGDKEIRYDVRVVNDYSDIVWFRYEGKTVFDESGNPVRVVGRTLDVTEEKGGTGIISDGRRDQLTGALVYDAFRELVESKLTENCEKTSALVIVGLDRFDEIADISEIDNIQCALAKILKGQSAVEQGSAYSRIKDGLFAFYVRFSDIPNLNAIVTRVIFRFHDFQFSDGHNGKMITVSAGISMFVNHKAYDTAYKEAYAAFSAAAMKGGNGFMHYNASMLIRSDISTESEEDILEGVSGAVGTEKIYHLLNLALTDKEKVRNALSGAFRLVGEYTECSSIKLVRIIDGSEDTYMPWTKSGKKDDSVPSVIPSVSTEQLLGILKTEKHIIISADKSADKKYGLALANGATNAVCCPIRTGNDVVGYFALVSDMPITWQESDIGVIEALSNTLDALFARYYDYIYASKRSSFAISVINDLNIEGFTISPDAYTVDYFSENAAKSYGLKKGDICYKKIRGLDAPCADCPTHQLKAGQLKASAAYYKEDTNRWLDITASHYAAEDGSARYAISTADITPCIGKIRTRDSLTGLMSFDSFAVDAMRLTAQNPEYGYIAVISIANFRRLNESSGYECGNTVLISVADILQSSLGAGELLCRSEGARFVALYRNTNNNDLLTRLNQMFQSAQSQVMEKTGLQIYIIAGAYELTGESSSIMAALDRALLAQKTIKNKAYYTSNLVAFYDNTLREEMQTRQYVETHMVEALDNGEFKVFYQPKVCTETGEIVGAEALVRWIRPDGEMISPGKFVPVFEQNGFITDMDFAIYRSAIADIKRWMRDGKKIPTISLNVSRQHMRDETFPDKICALVDNLGVPRNMIELEITESMLTENMNRLLDIMTRLKEAGFRISVDDFGSGYSSLNLITLLPFDTLKIDGGFFLRNDLTEKNKAVITSVVELAKNLKLTTVSEGVETDEQVTFLRELGCDMIQGYYYYKPMPVSNFEDIIR